MNDRLQIRYWIVSLMMLRCILDAHRNPSMHTNEANAADKLLVELEAELLVQQKQWDETVAAYARKAANSKDESPQLPLT